MTLQLKKLREVAHVIMGTSPKGHTYNTAGEGMPLLNGPTEFGAKYPECTVFTTASVKECESGDLIFCVRGSTTGRMNWADRAYSLGRGVCAIRGQDDSDTRFIGYSLQHRLPALLQLAGGATFPNLPQDTIRSFQIHFPPTRKQIGAILSAYDDLLENNRRRMSLLENAARLLYQEWFVRLRFPGYEHSRITRGIPEGWERKRLADIAKVNGTSLSGSYDGEIEYIDIASVVPGEITGTTRFAFRDAPSRARRVVEHGDIIWSCVRPNRRSARRHLEARGEPHCLHRVCCHHAQGGLLHVSILRNHHRRLRRLPCQSRSRRRLSGRPCLRFRAGRDSRSGQASACRF